MSKVYVVRYGHEYDHSRILGVFEAKSDARAALNTLLENNTLGFNDCYIEKIELTKKKKPNNGKS